MKQEHSTAVECLLANMWAIGDSNLGPQHYQCCALTS